MTLYDGDGFCDIVLFLYIDFVYKHEMNDKVFVFCDELNCSVKYRILNIFPFNSLSKSNGVTVLLYCL